MNYGSLILEKREYVYLKRLLNISGYADHVTIQESLIRLSEELRNAQILDEENMPDDIIRFNSRVTVSTDTGRQRSLQIVIPSNRDIKQNKISVLSPMGSALFGYSTGDTIEWNLPNGKQKIRIVAVVQEEPYLRLDESL